MANPLSQPFGAYQYTDFQTKIQGIDLEFETSAAVTAKRVVALGTDGKVALAATDSTASLGVGIGTWVPQLVPRIAKSSFANRHFYKAIRQFGECQNHSKQQNKLKKGQIITCNFAVQLKHRPVKQVQTI